MYHKYRQSSFDVLIIDRLRYKLEYEEFMLRDTDAGVTVIGKCAVSYTHLTLPTIYSV